MSDFKNCPDVRLAATEDMDELMRLAELAHEENEHWQQGYSPEKVYITFSKHFTKGGVLIAVIGDKGEELKAVLVMCVDQPWYSRDWRLLELALFVSPEHRRSTYAKQLMEFSKQASKGLQLDLTIGVFSSKNLERKQRLYNRQFGQYQSGTFYNVPFSGA